MGHDHPHDHTHPQTDWKHDGVRVVPGNQLDGNVPSTPGMDRKAAINFARVGAQKLWAGPGDFIYVPPYVPHQEINASATEVLECVLCRSDGQAVAVNLDIEPVEKPENVLWVDPTHPHGGV
jgi:uncharacterized RmlC-like cupin family protein